MIVIDNNISKSHYSNSTFIPFNIKVFREDR